MRRLGSNSLIGKFGLRLITMTWIVMPFVSANAQNSALPEKIQALELSYLGEDIIVFYSKDYAERAADLQEMAITANRFFKDEKSLGVDLDITVLVLDSIDWVQVTKLPYGTSHILSNSPTIVLPASDDNVLSNQLFGMKEHLSKVTLEKFDKIGFSFDDAVPIFADLIGFHEIGHIYSREFGIWPTEKWLSEFIATYLAYAFMKENKPHFSQVWDIMTNAMFEQQGFEFTSLADFERLYMGVGGDNYGWYQASFQQRIAEVYECSGMSFIHSLKISLEKNPVSLKNDPFRLQELDIICEGFTSWAKGEDGNLE